MRKPQDFDDLFNAPKKPIPLPSQEAQRKPDATAARQAIQRAAESAAAPSRNAGSLARKVVAALDAIDREEAAR